MATPAGFPAAGRNTSRRAWHSLAILGFVASKLTLREGIAPVRERLLATLFLAGVLHAIVILGITFTASAKSGSGAPGLQVLLTSE
jgi:hypothetical protein